MSQEALSKVIERASTDAAFRTQLTSSPESALAGSSTTGFIQPITVGTSTSADSSSVMVRVMCRRRDSRAAIRCHDSPAGCAPRVRSRWTQSHPVSSRTLSSVTPTSQIAISSGSSGSSRTVILGVPVESATADDDELTSPYAAPAAASVGRIERGTGDGVLRATDPGVGTAATSARAAGEAATRAFHVCAAVTMGSVAINASAMAATT